MRERERVWVRGVNETDVIGLWWGVNCQWKATPLIVSSAPSSRQVICRGAGEGGDGGIGEVEKGVFPFFFLEKKGEGWKEVEAGGIPGVRLTRSSLPLRSNRWKVASKIIASILIILPSCVSHRKY